MAARRCEACAACPSIRGNDIDRGAKTRHRGSLDWQLSASCSDAVPRPSRGRSRSIARRDALRGNGDRRQRPVINPKFRDYHLPSFADIPCTEVFFADMIDLLCFHRLSAHSAPAPLPIGETEGSKCAGDPGGGEIARPERAARRAGLHKRVPGFQALRSPGDARKTGETALAGALPWRARGAAPLSRVERGSNLSAQ